MFRSKKEQRFQGFVFQSVANSLLGSDALLDQLKAMLHDLREQQVLANGITKSGAYRSEQLQMEIDNTIELIRLHRHIRAAIKRARSEGLSLS